MEQDCSITTTPALTLLSLPAEILNEICTHIVPSNQTFLLNARKPETPYHKTQPHPQVYPRIRKTPLFPEGEPIPQPPATVFNNYKIDIFALLLLQSKLHIHIIKCLYSNNIFYPPDLPTLRCLKNTLSSLAISSIRAIRIDACGPATCFFRGYNHFYSWNQLADINVATIPDLFPGLQELRLGGVGPGIVHRRAFTYRGSRCVRDTEINDIWALHNIDLIAEIVGFGTPNDPETRDEAMTSRRVLGDGRVFCMRYAEADSSSLPRGTHRLHGTRIIRRGEVVRMGSKEQEVVDVGAALARAREANEEFKALGLSEVSTNDIVR